MDKVRRELGPDAVILHTKKYTTGGIFGYGGKKMVEITAAVEDIPKQEILPKVILPAKKTNISHPANNKDSLTVSPEPAKMVLPKQVLQNYKSNGEMSSLKDMPVPILQTKTKAAKTSKIIKASNNITDLEKSNSVEKKQEKKIQQLQQELAQMKTMLNKVLQGQNSTGASKEILLSDALNEQEIKKTLINEILNIDNNGDENKNLFKNSLQSKNILLKYLRGYMSDSAGIEMEKGHAKVVALIGATGVGKTTTLAKIASRFVLEQGLRAALITADTYRISAVDQLKTYSDIIGLPLEIVYSPIELKNMIDKHNDKQLILIDTAGRSQHNDYQLTELHDFLAVNENIEKHLVLSATTKYKDIVDIIRKFSLCAPDKIIFTKTDETRSVGMIVNLLEEYPITLSYFTNGQSVPDDIFPAKPENLADLLLR